MRNLVAELGGQATAGGGALHPLLVQRDVHTVGVLLVTPDRGLAGSLNTNVIRRGTEVILENERSDGQTVQVVTVGRKGQDFLADAVAPCSHFYRHRRASALRRRDPHRAGHHRQLHLGRDRSRAARLPTLHLDTVAAAGGRAAAADHTA